MDKSTAKKSSNKDTHLKIERIFSDAKTKPFDEINWEKRTAEITDDTGKAIFKQENVEVPSFWSQLATKVVCSKYFYGDPTKPEEREFSAKQLIHRVSRTISDWGVADGYFSKEDGEIFYEELTWLCINQFGAFNSPVWFNVGLHQEYKAGRNSSQGNWYYNPTTESAKRASTQYEYPQGSACFILSVDDDMESIMNLACAEAMLFKYGSGTGTDLTPIRSSREKLSGGGIPSGPMSFLKIYDQVANVVKSGGKCLPGNQLVFSENGPQSVSILASKNDGKFIAVSYDPPTKQIKAKNATAWLSGYKNIVRVTTDKGIFETSDDHPFRLSSHEYCLAKDLKVNMSLHAGSVNEFVGYYKVHLQNGKKGKELFHRMVASQIKGERIDGKAVHHIDECRANNNPNNLAVLTKSKHAEIHCNKLVSEGNHIFQLQKFSHAGSDNGMHGSSNFWKDERKVKSLSKKQSKILLKRGDAAEIQKLATKQKMRNTLYTLINKGYKVKTWEDYCQSRKKCFGYCIDRRKIKNTIQKVFGSYEKFVESSRELNHKVISVENIGLQTVYSVEVECQTLDDKSPSSGHNFLIWPLNQHEAKSGVFVSNTRRSAKINTIRDWHGDIEEFITAKAKEEKKAWALIDQGYDGSFNGEAYGSIMYQNANLSVRVSDEFMQTTISGGDWYTRALSTGQVLEKKNASKLMDQVAEGTHICGDPGLQYDGAIQKWHTCKGTGLIHSTNPCQPNFATVLTPKGIRTFKDIDVGSTIWSGDKWVKVSNKWTTGIKSVFKYCTAAGEFVGTSNHKVFSRGKKIEAKNALFIDACTCSDGSILNEIDANKDNYCKKPYVVYKVEPLGEFPVYDITVDDEHHTYWTGGLLVSNCSEYVFLNNTACNLASLNLMKFKKVDNSFDVDRFKVAVRIFITAQEILVDNASYPTKAIAENSHIFRTLGLGYANLGSLIMSYGLAYDSNEGRALAGAITAIMTGQAYEQSANIAEVKGPFAGYRDARCSGVDHPTSPDNVESMLGVMRLHRDAVEQIQPSNDFNYLKEEARKSWAGALQSGSEFGYRNAQVTVLAPTGTIAFLMDCDTTGVEPDIALVKYKLLAGGGMLKLVNRTVPEALRRLRYNDSEILAIEKHIEQFDTIENVNANDRIMFSGLKQEHLSVFDCAFKANKGSRSIHYKAHLGMMAAVQPFISGAISKTVNMPNEATIEEIRNTYIDAWKLGLKCVAIYRDGSKRSQPLSTKTDKTKAEQLKPAVDLAAVAAINLRVSELELELEKVKEKNKTQSIRRRLPDTRAAINHKFEIAGHEGYVSVGLFEDGQPGELFVTMAKEGSTVGGLMDTIGLLTSMSLQHGVPLESLVKKFAHQRFEPSGFTKNPDIRNASSVIDYVFRWMAGKFIPSYKVINGDVEPKMIPEGKDQLSSTFKNQTDAPSCFQCGHITIRNGSCYKCLNCGESLGCS